MGMPLREYYPVARAAELLGCKIEDLFHWASVGGINIYLSIELGMGYMHFCNENDELEEQFEEKALARDGFSTVSAIYILEDDAAKAFFQKEPPFEGFKPCTFNGLWALPRSAYCYDDLMEFKPSFFDLWLSSNSLMFIAFEDDSYLNPLESDLYLMKSDFLLISKIINGVEITNSFKEIPNYFNEGRERLNLDSNKSDNSISQVRNSRTARDAIKIMAKKHYPEIAGNYKKLAEVLSAEANEIEGMAGIRFDDSTVGRWMKD
ncbi:TPA: hypothetical protein I8438_005292 [Serratia marcescens]|nr:MULTISPECIES: hypothetical protein [Serratia]UBI62268.1 hypothetical protein GF111_15380 [Serratia sp. HRI]HAT2213404.1 hypothetical protein [Serratia marcescens]HAT2224627.1 hypothetical protein [Serratia marcescens]HAT2277017.1 hypothetical protein [Serratia marcescens]HAT2335378.1 hypothetical protein [Serratia marcescens]